MDSGWSSMNGFGGRKGVSNRSGSSRLRGGSSRTDSARDQFGGRSGQHFGALSEQQYGSRPDQHYGSRANQFASQASQFASQPSQFASQTSQFASQANQFGSLTDQFASQKQNFGASLGTNPSESAYASILSNFYEPQPSSSSHQKNELHNIIERYKKELDESFNAKRELEREIDGLELQVKQLHDDKASREFMSKRDNFNKSEFERLIVTHNRVMDENKQLLHRIQMMEQGRDALMHKCDEAVRRLEEGERENDTLRESLTLANETLTRVQNSPMSRPTNLMEMDKLRSIFADQPQFMTGNGEPNWDLLRNMLHDSLETEHMPSQHMPSQHMPSQHMPSPAPGVWSRIEGQRPTSTLSAKSRLTVKGAPGKIEKKRGGRKITDRAIRNRLGNSN